MQFQPCVSYDAVDVLAISRRVSSTDAVVVWDWALSLPREWRFVRTISACLNPGPSHHLADMAYAVDTSQARVPVLPVSRSNGDIRCHRRTRSIRYWVMAVVPYLLWAFCTNHTLEECLRIFRVCVIPESCRSLKLTASLQIPVALAMWNQVGAEAILLIRTYAFFNRNIYILALLVSALGGVVAYQLFVAISRMDRKYG